MARRSLLAPFLATLAALPLAASAAGFDSGNEAWSIPAGSGTLTWQSSGGNGGGWVQVEDIDGNTDILLTAPSAWLGNWTGFLGGTLSFDVKAVNDVSTDWAGFGEICISGPGGSLLLDAAAGQPSTAWTHYSVALTPAAGWTGGSLNAVLANVTSLTINGEFHSGPGEIVGFDNIAVTAVPEPESAALLLAGLGMLVGLRRKH